MCLGLFGGRSTNAALSLARAPARWRRSSASRCCAAPRAAAGLGDRRPHRAPHRGHRAPGARERDAPARPHRGHRRGADDRRRARDVRVGLRRRARRLRSPRRSTTTSRPARRRRATTASRRSRRARCGGDAGRRRRRRSAPCASRQAKVAGERQDSGRPAIDPRRFTTLYGIDVKQGRARRDRGRCARRRAGAGRARGTPRPQPERRQHARPLTTPTRGKTVALQGRRRSTTTTAACCADLIVRQPLMARDFGERKDAFGFVGVAPGADAKAVKRRIDGAARPRVPRRPRSLTDKEFKDQQAGQVDQLLALIYALLALAIIVVAVRHREHARALDQRAHARARDAAGDRHLAQAGQADGPLRGRHHGADRRRAGRGARDRSWRCSFTRPLDGFMLASRSATLVVLLVLAALAGVLAACCRRAARRSSTCSRRSPTSRGAARARPAAGRRAPRAAGRRSAARPGAAASSGTGPRRARAPARAPRAAGGQQGLRGARPGPAAPALRARR